MQRLILTITPGSKGDYALHIAYEDLWTEEVTRTRGTFRSDELTVLQWALEEIDEYQRAVAAARASETSVGT